MRAIVRNNFPLLQCLCENGCPWGGEEDCITAVEYRRLKHLQYLHEKGCPWSARAETCPWRWRWGRQTYFCIYCAVAALFCPHLRALDPCDTFEEVVQCFVESGYTWDLTPTAVLDCLVKINFKGLELMINNGCLWHPATVHFVILYKNFEMFKWVHALGAPWPEQVCLWLAEKGLIEWLQYAHIHGAVILPDTCEQLLQSPRLTSQLFECFKYAHQKGGCVLHQAHAIKAARDRHEEYVSYLKSQGCGV